MTRLKDEWVRPIGNGLCESEQDLKSKTGLTYLALAARAAGKTEEELEKACRNRLVGVIPITTGQGIIGSFAGAVASILNHLGAAAFVTEKSDVAGIYEASQLGAEILFMADDRVFMALNLTTNRSADNSEATAAGFVAALEGIAEDLKQKSVPVIGCGLVGHSMLRLLQEKQAIPLVYDKNPEVMEAAAKEGYQLLEGLESLKQYPWVLDATNTGGWLSGDLLHPEAWVVTPGVPLSLNREGERKYNHRLVHDYLPVGVAVMLAMVV